MIIGERKPLEEVLGLVRGHKQVLVAGCKTCVTICYAGGRKEVGLLASQLRMARARENDPIETVELTHERQCEPEFVDEFKKEVQNSEAVVSLACGIGVQTLAAMFPDKPIYPGINTTFLGRPLEQGIWAENCAACGNCVLGVTGGICPISRCSKSMLNGPCGGSQDGKCEVGTDIDCAWQLIYDRLKALGRVQWMDGVEPPKDWSTAGHGGPRKIVREDLVIESLEEAMSKGRKDAPAKEGGH